MINAREPCFTSRLSSSPCSSRLFSLAGIVPVGSSLAPGRDSGGVRALGVIVLRDGLAESNGVVNFVLAGNVLEELLDEVDMGENHAAAAIAVEADGIESVPRRRCG